MSEIAVASRYIPMCSALDQGGCLRDLQRVHSVTPRYTPLHPVLLTQVKLVETLKEVKLQEPDTSFLAPEYVEILDNEEQIKRELKEQPGRLQFLYGLITDLYVDNFKFKGQNVTQHVPQLQRTLHDYSLDAVLAFFIR